MAQRKYVEFGYIKHNQKNINRQTSNQMIDPNQPEIVSQEELIALIQAHTGKSDSTIREVIRLFSEYVDEKLETQDEVYITLPEEPDILIKKLKAN